MTGPRVVEFFDVHSARSLEQQERLLQRAAIRLRESGFELPTAKACFDGVVDRLPTRHLSDTRADEIWEKAAKVVDPGLCDPWAIPIDLSDWRTAEAPPWIVPGLLQRGSVTLISAKGGAGKSLLMQALVFHLAAGDRGQFLAFDLPGDPVPVAIVEAECGTRRIKCRLREFVIGGELSAVSADGALVNLYPYTTETLVSPGGLFDRFPDLTGRLPDLRVIVVDPLRSFLPSSVEDENANLAVGRVLDRLVALAKRENVAILIIDHDSKDGRAARGASVKRDAAEILWHLTAPDEADEDYLELRSDKHRDRGGPSKVAFRRVCEPRTEDGLYPVRFEVTEARTLSAARSADERASRAVRIVQVVEAHHRATGSGAFAPQVEKEIGGSLATVKRELRALAEAGVLFHPGGRSGYYPVDAKEAS